MSTPTTNLIAFPTQFRQSANPGAEQPQDHIFHALRALALRLEALGRDPVTEGEFSIAQGGLDSSTMIQVQFRRFIAEMAPIRETLDDRIITADFIFARDRPGVYSHDVMRWHSAEDFEFSTKTQQVGSRQLSSHPHLLRDCCNELLTWAKAAATESPQLRIRLSEMQRRYESGGRHLQAI